MNENQITYPKTIRDFSEIEMETLSNLPFRKKTLGRSKTAMEYIKILICMIEANGGKPRIPFAYLAKLFKSPTMANNVLKAARCGIVEIDPHYDKALGIAHKFQIADRFKNINIYSKLRDFPRSEKNTTPKNITPINITSINDTPKNITIMKPEPEQEPATPKPTIADRIRTQCEQLATQPNIIQQYMKVGLNPTESKICSCCAEEYPLTMYAISNNGTFDSCRACFRLDPEKAKASNTMEDPALIQTRAVMAGLSNLRSFKNSLKKYA